jgi:sec-independent protein translocase protein TatA
MQLGLWEILLIILVIVVLFGASRIPKLMRGMGQGVKEFKQGLRGEGEEEEEEKK